jgi:hypothetical protein
VAPSRECSWECWECCRAAVICALLTLRCHCPLILCGPSTAVAPCHPLHEPHRGVTLSGFAVALVAGLTPAGKAACRLALITDGPPVINASVPSGTRILRFITAT